MTSSFSGFLNKHKEIFSVPYYSTHFAFQDALASHPYPPQQWLIDQAYHKMATADPQRAKFCFHTKGTCCLYPLSPASAGPWLFSWCNRHQLFSCSPQASLEIQSHMNDNYIWMTYIGTNGKRWTTWRPKGTKGSLDISSSHLDHILNKNAQILDVGRPLSSPTSIRELSITMPLATPHNAQPDLQFTENLNLWVHSKSEPCRSADLLCT